MSLRVLMIDSEIDHLEAVKEYFSSSSSILVEKAVSTYQDALNYLESDYDVLVLNMLLPNNDSIKILSKYKDLKLNKKVVITSEFICPNMMNELNSYNPNYVLKKPYSLETLENVLYSVTKNIFNRDNNLKIEITDMLHDLGMPSHIKGFNYIRDGIELMYNDKKYMNAITKELYPKIALLNETTSSRVERAIRHAIEVSWMRGDYDVMEEIFKNSVDFDRAKPTNSEFIATLTDRLKLHRISE